MANNTYDAYVIGYSGVYVKEYQEDTKNGTDYSQSRVVVTGDLQEAMTITNDIVARVILNGVRKVASFDHFVLIKVEVIVILKKKEGSLS